MFKLFIKNTFIIFLLFSSSACSVKFWKTHFPNIAYNDPPKALATAHPDFRQGWLDGCEVGVSSGANTFYKMFYRSNAVDGYKVTESADYKSAWNAAFWYCYRYQYVKNKSSNWGSMFGGYQ